MPTQEAMISARMFRGAKSLRSARIVVTSVLFVAFGGCATQPPQIPDNVFVGIASATLPPSPATPGAALPKFVALHFSSLDVVRGQTWSGQIVTGTNVASVEVRTNLFSINVPRTQYGRFAFTLNVFDIPPIFVRKYSLRVIARNTQGMQVEEDLPFRIR